MELCQTLTEAVRIMRALEAANRELDFLQEPVEINWLHVERVAACRERVLAPARLDLSTFWPARKV
jgi:hypothetical protein